MSEEPTPPPAHIAELTDGCVLAVKQALGIELDLTQDTLPVLDHYLASVPEDAGDEVMGLVGPLAGAYFGEVVRRHLPGARWHAPDDDYRHWRIELERCFLHFNPVGMAFEAILSDDVPEWSAHLSVRDADKALVRDALETLGEVEPDDYYRLSVRFEVIELAYHTLMAKVGAKGKVQRVFGPDDYAEATADADDEGDAGDEGDAPN